MKRVLFTLLFLVSVLSTFAQVKKEGGTYYMYEAMYVFSLEFSSGQSYATIVRSPTYTNNVVMKENGKPVVFTSTINALNYLSRLGWECTKYNGSGIYEFRRKATIAELDKNIAENKLLVSDSEFREALDRSRSTTKMMCPYFSEDKISNIGK